MGMSCRRCGEFRPSAQLQNAAVVNFLNEEAGAIAHSLKKIVFGLPQILFLQLNSVSLFALRYVLFS